MLESVIISTLAGSIICTALLIFKNKLLSLLGGKALYYISLIAMLLFLLPMNIGDISLPTAATYPISNTTEFETTTPELNTDIAPVTAPQPEAPQEMQHNVLPQASNMVRRSNPITMQEILLAVWLLGFIISMCRYFISYFRFKKKICGFEAHEVIDGVEVIKSPLITSPLVFGFFRPTLAIPEIEMNEEDYNLAIKHEMVHYKHHDSWFKLFAVIVNSTCWFNPITYFMVNLIGEACEYACDEQVIKEMDMTDKKQYSTMILSMVCQASPALSSNMVKNKKQLKRRFEMIMKKKRFSVFKTVLCTVLMLALTCGSVVLANEAAPLVSSLLKEDYVCISVNFEEFIPDQKDGEYYLPWRKFLNAARVDNDNIEYANGKIKVDVMSGTGFTQVDGEEVSIPPKVIWSTSCEIGKRTVIIDNKAYDIQNAPYIDNGITYVPYEYIKLLKEYEDGIVADISNSTNKFSSVMKYGFDSFASRYYCDDIFISVLPDELDMPTFDEQNSPLVLFAVWNSKDTEAYIEKTGYRTEFHLKSYYFNHNNQVQNGTIEVSMNKVTRIYSKGSDIEGLFTLKINGEIIYDNETGYILGLPLPAGEGTIGTGETTVIIGNKFKSRLYFTGVSERAVGEYSWLNEENGKIDDMPNTNLISVYPSQVKLNGYTVTQSNNESFLRYNIEENYADIVIRFDDYNGELVNNHYRIHREESHDVKMLDNDTFSGHFYFDKNEERFDSFDAIVTLLPDNKFELKSIDGKYIVRGTTGEFIPQWQKTEEQKQAPLPQVVMIDE